LLAHTHPGSDLSSYIEELPSALSDDMCTELYAAHLRKVPLFQGVQPSFFQRLCREMQMRVFLTGELRSLP
jgi:hypothetical protein